jgi:hypothetical protein
MRRVNAAVDEALGRLVASIAEEDYVVVASLHGMGTNVTDVASMVLLPELLHRAFGGGPVLRGASVGIGPDTTWDATMERHLWGPWQAGLRAVARRALPSSLRRWVQRRVRPGVRVASVESVGTGAFGRPIAAETDEWRSLDGPFRRSLDWQMPSRYRPAWPAMAAFALPTNDFGKIRLNVAGREANGTIAPEEYDAWCDRVAQLLHSVTDPATGAPVVDRIERVGSDAADMVVHWAGPVLAFAHPTLGVIGPYPPRRTGGHEDPTGFAFVAGPGIAAGDLGRRSAADVTPTLTALLGLDCDVAGESLVQPISLTG